MAEKIPRLRTDIECIPAAYEGKQGIVVRDPLGLIREPIFLYGDILAFMGLIDGQRGKRDIQAEIVRRQGGLLVDLEEVERILGEMDDIYLLDSQRYEEAKTENIRCYLELDVRTAALAGRSYPGDRGKLEAYIKQFLQGDKAGLPEPKYPEIDALIVPHIQLDSGRKLYGRAYRTVAPFSPGRIVLIGTGHHVQDGLIAVTEKNFETPLGRVETDKDFVRLLKDKGGGVIVPHDMAHRNEHSLEFQLIFLQYLFGSKFSLVPLLFGSFQHLLNHCGRPSEIPGMEVLLKSITRYLKDYSGRTLIVAGVDLSHVGPKFGHDTAAPAMLAETKAHDRAVIAAVRSGNVEELWQIVAGVDDRYNVCGFSTLACLLEILAGGRGTLLGYDIYEEAQTRSAVTFAALTMTGG